MASDWQGVSIAPGFTIFDAEPDWVRIDNYPGDVRVDSVSIRRGRRSEFERTDTGTATVVVNDRDGVLDPTNAAGPFFGELDGVPIAIAIRNPVTDEWFPLFRGQVEDIRGDLHGSQVKNTFVIECVDALDYLANFELAPGLAGEAVVPASVEGNIFYEDTAGTVDDRIIQALADANWNTDLQSVFTGNVSVQETIYSPGDSILSVIHDAADAEFPTVANVFVDTFGFVCFHGRLARFIPDIVSATATHWDFNRWKVGDGAAIAGDPERAQIRPPFVYSRSLKMVRNQALAYPQGILPQHMNAQVVQDLTSIGKFGVKPWSAENLVVLEGTTTGNTAREECQLYAEYIVDNYAEVRTRIDQVTLRSLRPDDPRAEATWALLCDVDISDIVHVQIGHPGGGGFDESFYIEGVTYELKPLHYDLDTGYPDVTLTLDLSDQSYWGVNPF